MDAIFIQIWRQLAPRRAPKLEQAATGWLAGWLAGSLAPCALRPAPAERPALWGGRANKLERRAGGQVRAPLEAGGSPRAPAANCTVGAGQVRRPPALGRQSRGQSQ